MTPGVARQVPGFIHIDDVLGVQGIDGGRRHVEFGHSGPAGLHREFGAVGRLEVTYEDAATVRERDHFSIVRGPAIHVLGEDTPSGGVTRPAVAVGTSDNQAAPRTVQHLPDAAVDTFCWPDG